MTGDCPAKSILSCQAHLMRKMQLISLRVQENIAVRLHLAFCHAMRCSDGSQCTRHAHAHIHAHANAHAHAFYLAATTPKYDRTHCIDLLIMASDHIAVSITWKQSEIVAPSGTNFPRPCCCRCHLLGLSVLSQLQL